MNIGAAVRLALGVVAAIDGLWLASLALIWLGTGVVPPNLVPSALLSGGALLLILGTAIALQAERDGRAAEIEPATRRR